MGDRVNVIVGDIVTSEGISIYSHWGGHRMPDTVARFLVNSQRSDFDYFTRNLLMRVVADGARRDGVSGFDLVETLKESELREFIGIFEDQLSYGIGIWLAGDREYPILVLDPTLKKVFLVDDYSIVTIKEALARCNEYNSRTFDEFKEVANWADVKNLFNTIESLV